MDLRGFGLSDEDLRALGYRVDAPARGRAPLPEEVSRRPNAAPGPARRPADPQTRLWAVTLLLLAGSAWASGIGRGLPGPRAAAAPDTSFSSARAMAGLVEIARSPRPVGSPEHERVRAYLSDRLESFGLDPETRVGTVTDRYGSVARAVTVRNVVATLRGSDPDLAPVYLSAAYDGPPSSLGAAHNGLGVATLLEVTRALAASPQLTRDVLIAFTDGGELGAVGERAARAVLEEAGGVHAALSVRGNGGSGAVVPVGIGPAGVVGLEALARSDVRAPLFSSAVGLLGAQAGSGSPGGDGALDAQGGVVLTTLAKTPPHAWGDVPADVSERTLQQAGEQLLAAARRLGGTGHVVGGRAPVFLTLPLLGAVGYPGSWLWPSTVGLVLGWLGLLLLVRGRGGRPVGGLAGVALGATIVAAGVGAGLGLLRLLRELHPEHAAIPGFYRSGPHAAALATLTVGIVALTLGLFRRRVRSDELLAGAAAVPLALVLGLTIRAPELAPAAQWPFAVSLLGAAAVTLLGPVRARSAPAWAVAMIVGAALMVTTVPSLQLAVAGWGIDEAALLGGIFGVVGVVALPIAGWVIGPKGWWTVTGSVAVAALLVGTALPSVRGPNGHPTPTALAYLTETPAGTGAMLARLDGADTSRVRTMAGEWLTARGPGERWARSWVAEPPSGSTAPGVLLIAANDDAGRAFVDPHWERAGGAPDVSIAEPRVRVLESVLEDGRRMSWLAVEPGLGGEMVGLRLAEGAPGSIAGVEDFGWPEQEIRTLTHWGAPRNGAVIVWLETPPEAEWADLILVEHHLRPRELLGGSFFQRPDSLVPNAFLGSDRVIQRTSLRIPLSDSGTPASADDG